MTLQELGSESAVQDFINQHPHAIVTFSAHWCGPCKASKPQLEAMAAANTNMPFGIVYESDLGEALQSFNIRAFPTYVLFHATKEIERVEGANMAAVAELAKKVTTNTMTGAGEVLGGGNTTVLTPAQAREARLAKLSAPAAAAAVPMDVDAADSTVKPPAATPTPVAAAAPPASAPTEKEQDDVEMEDTDECTKVPPDPAAGLDPEMIATLTDAMGFSLLRAQKGLLMGNSKTVEGAIEWLTEHQDDPDIDDPITTASLTAQSYKCNECGKILSNMANLELHANKTGHSDFEESTQSVKPLTEEEKAEKLEHIKVLLKAKRAEREEAEKVDMTEREKQRRFMGKEMAKTREQVEAEQRKREAYLRRKEKEDFKKERQRLRMELAKDKAERAAHKGKLKTKLGVEGYKPDAIQYDKDDGEQEEGPSSPQKPKTKVTVDAGRIDEYISKVASYRAGGDGENCLKVLKVYVSNPVDKPDDPKYRTIKMTNKAYVQKVKPLIGAKKILLACGFVENETGTALTLGDDANMQVLADTKAKLEKALPSN